MTDASMWNAKRTRVYTQDTNAT